MPDFSLNGVTLSAPDWALSDRIRRKLESGAYEADEARAVMQRVHKGQRVLDLGAGLGYIASLAAQITDGANVVSVEANPRMLPVIRANLDRNGAAEATLLHGAVAGLEDTGEVYFDQTGSFWSGRLADMDARPENVVSVPLLRLHDLLKTHRPNLVFMDIEGAEAGLFDEKWPRFVRSVILELHPKRYPNSTIKTIVDCMSASGLTYDPACSRGRILGFRRLRAEGA